MSGFHYLWRPQSGFLFLLHSTNDALYEEVAARVALCRVAVGNPVECSYTHAVLPSFIYNNKLAKETFWAAAAKGCFVVGGLVIAVIVPRTAGPEVYGAFSLILAYATLASLFMGRSITVAVQKEMSEHKFGDGSKRYFLEAVKLHFLTAAIMSFAVYVVARVLELSIVTENFLLFVSFITVVNQWSLVNRGFEAVHRLFYNAIMYFCEYAVKILFIVALFAAAALTLPNLLIAFIAGYVVALTIGFAIMIRKLECRASDFRLGLDPMTSRSIMRRAGFYAMTGLTATLLTKIDSIMIGHYMTYNDVGFYNVASNVAMNLYIISFPVILGVAPMFSARTPLTGLYLRTLGRLSVINLAVFIALFAGAAPLISIVYGPTFVTSIPVLRIMAVIPFVVSIRNFSSRILVLKDGERVLLAVGLASVALNIFLNIVLIPCYGINGAAWATVLTFLSSMLILAPSAAQRITATT